MKLFKKIFLCCIFIFFLCDQLYGKDLYYLVVDKSESIHNVGLEKPITKAVKDFINTLSDDVELRVVFFSSKADPPKKWSSLTFDAKQDFFEYFSENFQPRGKTRLYDTVVEVVEEVYSVARDYDEIKIMILSDGENTVDSKYNGWSDIDILARNLKQDNNNAFVFWYTLGFEPASVPKEINVIKIKNPHQQIKIEPPPVADFDAYPRKIEVGQSVKFFVMPSSGIITNSSLDFGDGSTSNKLSMHHKYQSLGKYTVSLWVKGPGGEDSTKKINFIDVVPKVPLKADFSWSPPNPRVEDVVQLIDRSEGSPEVYSWNLDAYGTSSDTSPAIKAEKSGAIHISLIVKRGSQSDSIEKQIIIKPLPPNPAFKQSAKEIFAGDKLKLTAFENDPSVTHEWRINGKNISGGQSTQWIADENGMVEIQHRVTGPGGFSIEKSGVFVKGIGNVRFSVSPKSGVFPLDVSFNDESDITGIYHWDFGDGSVSTEKNPTHTYLNSGNYKVKLTITTAAGDEIPSPEPALVSVTSPSPWWLKWAIGAAVLSICVILIFLYFQDGPVSGSLKWKFKGSEGLEELNGKSFSLNEMNIPGWEPNQKYFIKNKRKREIQLLSDGIEIKKLGRKTEFRLEGASFTYFNQLINE